MLQLSAQTGKYPPAPQRDSFDVGNRPPAMHYFCMTKWLLIFFLGAVSALAQERPTAYQALRTVGTQLNRDFVNHVISVTGMDGNPQPETWKILLDDPHARGGIREVEVANGKIASERTPLRAAVEGSLGPVIETSKLNLDSSGAYTVAQQAAAGSHVTFIGADYVLRMDEKGNPVWQVTLHREGGEAAGSIYIGANHGTITRTQGLFTGGDVAAAARAPQGEEQPAEDVNDADDDDGDTNVVKLRIKRAFHQVRDDVKRGFHKVRRSFVDFFEDH